MYLALFDLDHFDDEVRRAQVSSIHIQDRRHSGSYTVANTPLQTMTTAITLTAAAGDGTILLANLQIETVDLWPNERAAYAGAAHRAHQAAAIADRYLAQTHPTAQRRPGVLVDIGLIDTVRSIATAHTLWEVQGRADTLKLVDLTQLEAHS